MDRPSLNVLFQKFHFKNNSIWWTMQQILRNDFEKWFWEMIYHGTSPMIYHFSKSFLKIWLFMFCLHSLAMVGWPIHSRTADTATVLSISQPAPIHREYEKNISRKFIYILLILKCTISENVVFEKWYFTTNDESRANQHWYHNEWRGGAESWVMISMLICKWWVMSCEISFLKNHIFRNFISILYIRSWTICN